MHGARLQAHPACLVSLIPKTLKTLIRMQTRSPCVPGRSTTRCLPATGRLP